MASSAVVKEKEKKDIRVKFNEFINDVIEKGRTSSIKFDPQFLKELETAGKEAREKKSMKPVKIIKNKTLTKPAITQALNLASDIELATTKGMKLDVQRWVKEGK